MLGQQKQGEQMQIQQKNLAVSQEDFLFGA